MIHIICLCIAAIVSFLLTCFIYKTLRKKIVNRRNNKSIIKCLQNWKNDINTEGFTLVRGMKKEMILFVIISISISVIIAFSTDKVFVGVICFVTMVIGALLFLYIWSGIRYKNTEKQILIFINLLENYSHTSDDLVDIIGKTESYIGEPIKSAVSKFQWEARHTGEIENSLNHLKNRLSHRKLQEIIYNLDICRKHEANYDEVIKDMRVSVQEYLKSKEERKDIRQSTKANVVVMMIVGVLIIKLVDGFVENGIINLLKSNLFGIIIMFYIVFVFLWGIWQFIRVDKD